MQKYMYIKVINLSKNTQNLSIIWPLYNNMSLYVGDRQVCTFDGHLHRVTYTSCINTIDSPQILFTTKIYGK